MFDCYLGVFRFLSKVWFIILLYCFDAVCRTKVIVEIAFVLWRSKALSLKICCFKAGDYRVIRFIQVRQISLIACRFGLTWISPKKFWLINQKVVRFTRSLEFDLKCPQVYKNWFVKQALW